MANYQRKVDIKNFIVARSAVKKNQNLLRITEEVLQPSCS
jgi:hypothetical protein